MKRVGLVTINWREGTRRRDKPPVDHGTGSNLKLDLNQQIPLALTT